MFVSRCIPGELDVLSHIMAQLSSASDTVKKDCRGRTALHNAAESSRSVGVIDRLLEKGGDMYARDDHGWTALHWAARWNNFEAVKKLMESGKPVKLLSSSCDSGGSSSLPSQVVCKENSPDLFRDLKEMEESSGVSSRVLEGASPREEKPVDAGVMSVFCFRSKVL